jgi:DNA-binding CsgD family transcriptional regulator
VKREHFERFLSARSHGLPVLSSVDELEAIRERLGDLERRLAALEGRDGARTGRGALGGLTESERRIVGLVVAGRTNDEVAQQLFLSPKTVEWSLTKVYRKLRVRSRTELVAKLASGVQAGNGRGS